MLICRSHQKHLSLIIDMKITNIVMIESAKKSFSIDLYLLNLLFPNFWSIFLVCDFVLPETLFIFLIETQKIE